MFQYEHILSFGAPLANTYKIVVDERELLFETSEVRARQFCYWSLPVLIARPLSNSSNGRKC